jgi:hypothetical protein
VQLESTLMGLCYPHVQRVPSRIGALRTGENPAPGLERRAVDRVASGADLHDDRVQVQRLRAIENEPQFGQR